jgi:hypothetical protein
MDNLLLQEVDDELAAMPNELIDDVDLITSVKVNLEWNSFRDQLASDMFDEYLLRHGELDISYTTHLMEKAVWDSFCVLHFVLGSLLMVFCGLTINSMQSNFCGLLQNACV